MDTAKIKTEPVRNEYTDMYFYQGLFYYGKSDSLIELRIEDGTSYFTVYSVNGNDIKKISEEVITNFSSVTKIIPDRYQVIYCKINDVEYKLSFAAVSVKNLKTVIAESKFPEALSISIHDYFGEEFMDAAGINKTEFMNDGSFTCQDFISLLGEYKAVSRHFISIFIRGWKESIEENTVQTHQDVKDFHIQIYGSYPDENYSLFHINSRGFESYDSYHDFLPHVRHMLKTNNILSIFSEYGGAETMHRMEYLLIDGRLYFEDTMYLDIRNKTYLDFYIMEKVF